MFAQIGAGIADQREAGGMGLGETIQSERADGLNDGILHHARDAIAGHACAQFDFNLGHAFLGAFEAEGAAQLLGFAAAELRGDHGDAQELLLKQRDAQRALEHGFEQRVQAGDFFLALAAVQIRVEHLTHNRAGADDGDLHDEVVELGRTKPWEA